MRQALAGADDLDLVRVVAAAGRDAVATITPDEASYLAGRRDWAGLWQLALSLPLADAVTAASLISDGWQPDDHAGQALLQQLATADAGQITLTITGGGPAADRPARTTGRSTHRPGRRPSAPAAAGLAPCRRETPASSAGAADARRPRHRGQPAAGLAQQTAGTARRLP